MNLTLRGFKRIFSKKPGARVAAAKPSSSLSVQSWANGAHRFLGSGVADCDFLGSLGPDCDFWNSMMFSPDIRFYHMDGFFILNLIRDNLWMIFRTKKHTFQQFWRSGSRYFKNPNPGPEAQKSKSGFTTLLYRHHIIFYTVQLFWPSSRTKAWNPPFPVTIQRAQIAALV